MLRVLINCYVIRLAPLNLPSLWEGARLIKYNRVKKKERKRNIQFREKEALKKKKERKTIVIFRAILRRGAILLLLDQGYSDCSTNVIKTDRERILETRNAREESSE